MALRVLLADNSESIRRVIQLALQDFGIEVKTIGSAPDVMEIARSWKPDVILVDILLQKQNGYAVAQTIKEDPELGVIPVVLMWSGFMDFDEAKAKATRAEGRLEKPFDSDGLRAVILQMVPRLKQHPLSQFVTPSRFDKADLQNPPQAAPPPKQTPPPPPPPELDDDLQQETQIMARSPLANIPTPLPKSAPQVPFAPTSFSGNPIPFPTSQPINQLSNQLSNHPSAPLNPPPLVDDDLPSTWNMESFDPVPPIELNLPELELEQPLTHVQAEPGDDDFFPDIEEVTQQSAKSLNPMTRSSEASFIDPLADSTYESLSGEEPEEFAHVPLAPLKNIETKSIPPALSVPPAKDAESLSDFGGENQDPEGDWQRQDIQSFQLDIPAGADAGAVVLDSELHQGRTSLIEAPFADQIPTDYSYDLDDKPRENKSAPEKPSRTIPPSIPSQLSDTSASQVTLQGALPPAPVAIAPEPQKEAEAPFKSASEFDSGSPQRRPVTRSAATIHPSLRPQQPPPPINPNTNSGMRVPSELRESVVTPPQPPTAPLQKASSSPARSAVTIDENSRAGVSGSHAVIPAPIPSPAKLQPDQVEEFLRNQAPDIIREIAQRLIPEIATQLIRAEIQRLLDESITSS